MKIPRNPFSEETDDLRPQHSYLTIAAICLFLLLLMRLWFLQVVKGEEYRALSESNRTRTQDIPPPRGLIMDRNGIILADNYPSYELSIIQEDVTDTDALARRLADLLYLPLADIKERFENIKSRPPFKPAQLLSDLNWEQMSAVESHRYDLPGVVVGVKHQRRYLYDMLGAHVVGYLGEVNEDQLGKPEYEDYRMGELVGQYGVEKELEESLHGKRGSRLVEVDSSGRVLMVLEQTDPTPGDNLYLTIDVRLQLAAQKALGRQAGAVVALDPNTGEVLALASMPTFSQNDFVKGLSHEQWQTLSDNPLHPLDNRAVGGQYPPGSTFKIVGAAAGLEEKAVTADTQIICTGSLKFGDRSFGCWNVHGHGAVNLRRSLKESCDVYYYEVGRRLGVDTLAKYARAFGLDRKTGIGLSNERPGLFPTKKWKLRRFKQPWRPGETLPVAIGQGFNLVTPLQMAQVTAITANGGTMYRPHLVKKITAPDGATIVQFGPEVVSRLNFAPETWTLIRDGLVAVVNEPGGTGGRARLEGITVAGKTGTSQVVSLKKYKGIKKKDLPYKYQDHAWFVCFAPAENPTIAVAVIVEHSGHGGVAAAPVAKAVLEAYFFPEKMPELNEENLAQIQIQAIPQTLAIQPGDQPTGD